MSIEEFAERNSVKIKRDECGDRIVSGRAGHIGDGHAEGKFGLYVMYGTPRRWNNVRRKLEASGMTIKQNGEVDGVVVFDSSNRTQTRLALGVARIRTKRTATPAQLASLAKARESRELTASA